MPRNTRNTGSESGPENPIAASVHGVVEAHGQRLLIAVKRFFRRLFIALILICLFVVPPLLYYTNLVPPVRTELRKLVADYSLYRKTKSELNDANLKISELEQKLANTNVAKPAPVEQDAPAPAPTPPPSPEPVPPPPRVSIPESTSPPEMAVRSKKNEKVTTLRNGVTVRSYVDIRQEETASNVRHRKEAYELETRLKINLPAANRTVSELSVLNPELPKILPGLDDLLKKSSVSPLFEKIYELKLERVIEDISSPSEMETRHNFYDCETILALTHPRSKKKVLLMQGEMDVVSDGTDGDRWPYLNEMITRSKYFQHATSYRWKKKSDTPNPLLARAEGELKRVLARYSIKGLSKSENTKLKNRRDELQRQIREMKSTSFLIGEVDPFIVLPLSFLNQNKLSHAPSIGDFAVVIYNNKLYPAICGDAGPSWKLGEGSLFLARTLNPKSNPNYRPVSDLKVTYLVFPGTAPKGEQPDLIKWRERCENLLEEIGGIGKNYYLHNWRDLPAERKAMIELEKLATQFTPFIERREKEVVEAKKALKATEEKVRNLKKEVTKLDEQLKKREEEAEASDNSETESSESAEPSEDESPEEVKPSKEEIKKAKKTRDNFRLAEEQLIMFEGKLKQAEQAATTAKTLKERTEAAIKKARDIVELPESTPREISTDIILTSLADSQAAVEMLKEE